MRFPAGALAVALALAGLSAGQPALTPAERQENLASFDRVWTTVRDKHWDPRINGVDWQAVCDELRPRVEKAATMDEARAAISDMLQRLQQSHFGILPAEAYRELDQSGGAPAASSSKGDPGIEVRVVEDHALVAFLTPGSPAATQGVKPGWEIQRLEGKEVAPGLAKIRRALGHSTLVDLMQARSLSARLEGPLDQTVDVEFLDAKDRPVALHLARAGPRGVVTGLGNLPPLHFWVDAHKVQPDIGYVRFNMFFEPDAVNDAMQKMVAECRDCSGFVVDLRGNAGGIGGLAMGLAGWFTSQSGLHLGTMYLRTTSIQFAVFPRADPFGGPLAILVDGCSASTAEIFAGGMQDLHRARIFGAHTAGAALLSLFETLPNGDGFQYAIANYISAGGRPLEGIGVTPDEEVPLTRQRLLEGHDPVLDAAVSWIHRQ
jgi:carboxyl-terminal processing protease